MTRTLTLLCVLAVARSALAQANPSPAPAPLEPPPPAMVPEAPPSAAPHLQLKEPGLKAPVRASRFSRGAGGPLLVFTGILTGIGTGITFNQALGGASQDNFAAAMLGALLVGGGSALLQYYADTSVYGSMLDGLAAVSGYALGFGIDLFTHSTGNSALFLPAILANAALVVSSLAHLDVAVDGDQALLVASSAVYATWLAILGTGLVAATHTDTDGRAILIAPALGMALGGGLAAVTHVGAGRMFKLLLLPLGVGTSLLYVGVLSSSADRPLVWGVAGAGTLGTLVLTGLLTAEDEPKAASPAPAAGVRVVPGLGVVKSATEGFKPALALSGRF